MITIKNVIEKIRFYTAVEKSVESNLFVSIVV